MLNQLSNALASGALYGLAAVGLSMLFYVTGTINFAHGEMYVLGGLFSFLLAVTMGVPVIVAVLVSTVAVAIVGVVIHTLIRGVLKVEPFNVLFATFAVSLLISNAVDEYLKGNARNVPSLASGQLTFGSVSLTYQRAIAVVVAIAAIGGIAWWLRASRTGRLIRAVASNRRGAEIIGVNTARIDQIVFGVAAAAAGLTGALLAPITQVTAFAGMPVLVKAFVVVVIGGLGSTWGALLGGLALGLIEGLTGSFLGNEWTLLAGNVLLIAALFARPYLVTRRAGVGSV